MHTLRCKASKIYTNMCPCHYFFLYLCVFLQSMSASLWKQCFQRLWYRYYQAYQTLFEIPIYLSNDLLNMSSNPLQLTFLPNSYIATTYFITPSTRHLALPINILPKGMRNVRKWLDMVAEGRDSGHTLIMFEEGGGGWC